MSKMTTAEKAFNRQKFDEEIAQVALMDRAAWVAARKKEESTYRFKREVQSCTEFLMHDQDMREDGTSARMGINYMPQSGVTVAIQYETVGSNRGLRMIVIQTAVRDTYSRRVGREIAERIFAGEDFQYFARTFPDTLGGRFQAASVVRVLIEQNQRRMGYLESGRAMLLGRRRDAPLLLKRYEAAFDLLDRRVMRKRVAEWLQQHKFDLYNPGQG